MSLIECVPNVSEGRRSTVVEMLAGEVRAVPGVRLLDYSADPSHNRSVFTMAGDRPALKTAVLALAWRAVDTIDLRTHRGEHPRLGAVDVVPFIPLGGTTMAECVELAREVGQADCRSIGRARVPLRRSGIARCPAPPRRHPAGSIRRAGGEDGASRSGRRISVPLRLIRPPGRPSSGARRALIAYNVNLATDRLDVARRIAAAVRASSGGLAVRESARPVAARSRHRAGLDEPDELRADADRGRVRSSRRRSRESGSRRAGE